MSIEKAWKDPDYRDGLTEIELDDLPENPAGATPLSSQSLNSVRGGRDPFEMSILPYVTCGQPTRSVIMTCAGPA
ncbi:mersacidin/lichenicidin family type 2 lantibiotic [Nocardiopsis alborubida]|uniref:Mersacidin/lichenicidin family type 2 lantibiotic n=1 Tax=Nocardiopsis alborubida TaxID=146802 RepID=A0A7X6MLW6_9ACTN|nr:mersacidin/lichenicidin family type 2 lantibiotic [Nocardiopsis alborubida]NKZ01881.1 mersacidin/lichenicidin family type 2 lantibiotic [Nocardiopsis alborubida]